MTMDKETMMKRLILIMVVLGVFAGCSLPMPGFRFAASEDQRQSAQITRDLAAGAGAHGMPPGSIGARTLARTASVGLTDTGPPEYHIDVAALVPQSDRDAWRTLMRQRDGLQSRTSLYGRSAAATLEALSKIASDVETLREVPVGQLIAKLQAVAIISEITSDVAGEIEVPPDPGVDPQADAAAKALAAAVSQLTSAAEAHAARRPTIGETLEAGEDQALDTIDQLGGVLESYGLLALIPGAGGVLYAARKRKAAKAATIEAQEARHAEANAKREAIMRQEIANSQAAQMIGALAQSAPVSAPVPATEGLAG